MASAIIRASSSAAAAVAAAALVCAVDAGPRAASRWGAWFGDDVDKGCTRTRAAAAAGEAGSGEEYACGVIPPSGVAFADALPPATGEADGQHDGDDPPQTGEHGSIATPARPNEYREDDVVHAPWHA